jgi:hypothetical protein
VAFPHPESKAALDADKKAEAQRRAPLSSGIDQKLVFSALPATYGRLGGFRQHRLVLQLLRYTMFLLA